MDSSKRLSASVSGVASVIGLAILFASAQAGAANELNSQQRAQQQSQQQIQQQTDRRSGPIPNQANQPNQPSQAKQLNQSGSAEQKRMYQNQHQYKYEKNLQKSENGHRATGVPGSGNNGNRSGNR